jgi:pimeloyl-ACP methyl ester carboxylesterase
MPILFVAGEADTQKIATGRSVASAVADGRLWVVPGSGHSPHLECPDLFWERVLAFWKDVEARAQEGRERSSRSGT